MEPIHARRVCLALALLLLLASPSAWAGGKTKITEIDLLPLEPRLQCETDVSGGEGHQVLSVICREEVLQPVALKCEDILDIITQGSTLATCLPSCKGCVLTPVAKARFDQALDRQCTKACQQGTCPAGKKCVLDKVVNKTDVPSCIANSLGCKNPTPDLCFRIERIGECTCKCV